MLVMMVRGGGGEVEGDNAGDLITCGEGFMLRHLWIVPVLSSPVLRAAPCSTDIQSDPPLFWCLCLPFQWLLQGKSPLGHIRKRS